MKLLIQEGFSLIEVMIATFVLAIGILGVAQLHLSSFQNNRDALYRNQATVIADDLLGRIRANPTALSSGAYNSLCFASDNRPSTEAADSKLCKEVTGPKPAYEGCDDVCGPTNIAVRDVHEWARNFLVDMSGYQPSLPGAQGSGNIDSADARGACPGMVKYDVKVQWLRANGESDQVALTACF